MGHQEYGVGVEETATLSQKSEKLPPTPTPSRNQFSRKVHGCTARPVLSLRWKFQQICGRNFLFVGTYNIELVQSSNLLHSSTSIIYQSYLILGNGHKY